jgi:hypothetical protein
MRQLKTVAFFLLRDILKKIAPENRGDLYDYLSFNSFEFKTRIYTLTVSKIIF